MKPKKIIICDIDGTLSHPGERLKYQKQDPPDWEKFYSDSFDDEPIPEVVNLINLLATKHLIYFLTSRSERVRKQTNAWIRNNIPWFRDLRETTLNYFLFMRPDDDETPSHILKPNLLIRMLHDFGLYPDSVLVVIDDNSLVCKAWRGLGYACLQVDDNDF